jgi:hypothetical protein
MNADPLRTVDAYLETWDAFAQGDESLVPRLRKDKLAFREALAGLLDAGDERAPGRLVFYALVQVGGSIEVHSALGAAARRLLGADFPTVCEEDEPDQPAYFAGDLYFWWKQNSARYARYALLDDWLARDFANEVAIPMYESAARARRND